MTRSTQSVDVHFIASFFHIKLYFKTAIRHQRSSITALKNNLRSQVHDPNGLELLLAAQLVALVRLIVVAIPAAVAKLVLVQAELANLAVGAAELAFAANVLVAGLLCLVRGIPAVVGSVAFFLAI